MRLALSLGFPHCDVMLRQITMNQLCELYAYFKVTDEENDAGQAEADERRLMHHLAKISAQQKLEGLNE